MKHVAINDRNVFYTLPVVQHLVSMVGDNVITAFCRGGGY
jgi:hypothetical protein